ncbi:hypothetical protein FRB91_011905 [Serendipita sp. 411]|nr:hypothetical protein FRC18_007577 [Serendipita sp. 400]KAG8847285.1 hypothetical protein FRB91_011905 [Serendipita sp. 411]
MVALVTTPAAALLKRQSSPQPPDPSGNGQQTARDNSLPDYIWVAVSFFVIMAIACGICARRNHRRQFLYRQAMLSSQRPAYTDPNQRQGLMDAAIAAAGIRRPPRARRRASQASVTSLPVYMENPGAQEVVLLQRTAPKEDDVPRPSSLASSPQMPIPNATGGGTTVLATNALPLATGPASPTSPTSPTSYAPPLGPPPVQTNPFLGSAFAPPASPPPPPLSPSSPSHSSPPSLPPGLEAREAPRISTQPLEPPATIAPPTTTNITSSSRPEIHTP